MYVRRWPRRSSIRLSRKGPIQRPFKNWKKPWSELQRRQSRQSSSTPASRRIYSLNSLAVRVPHSLSKTSKCTPDPGSVAQAWLPGCPDWFSYKTNAFLTMSVARAIKPLLFLTCSVARSIKPMVFLILFRTDTVKPAFFDTFSDRYCKTIGVLILFRTDTVKPMLF